MTPIYMISITHDEISQAYKRIAEKSWHDKGYHISHYEAVTPHTLSHYTSLSFERRKRSKGNNLFSDTEKAVWYSHYNLWNMCVELDEPICVIEHDSLLVDYLPDFTGSDIELFAVHDYRYDHIVRDVAHTVSPCAGYYIQPSAARDMINKARSSMISLNVDWTVHETYEDYHPETQRKYDLFQKVLLPQCVVRQIYDEQIGNTIIHNNNDAEAL